MKRKVVCLSKEYGYLKFMSTYITYPLTTESVCLPKSVCLSKVYVNLYYINTLHEGWKSSYSICMSIQSVCQPILHAYQKTEYDE